MLQKLKRRDGRTAMQIRTVSIVPHIFEYASGSVLFEIGKTKILCAVSMQNQVPLFLKGKKEGWLTCEYAMLPMATHVRTQRESNLVHKNGRSVEISRFLGRVLRAMIDPSVFPDRTIVVDCDVFQADGSTRVACVTAASLALLYAQHYWLKSKILEKNFIKESLYGISVGIVKNTLLVDLDYEEDSVAQADFNIVLTESGKLVEILGGSEKDSIDLDVFSTIQTIAVQGVELLKKEIQSFSVQILRDNSGTVEQYKSRAKEEQYQQNKKEPLFSIKNRLFNNKEL